MRQSIPSAVATGLLAVCFLFVTHDWARSLTGGTYVGPSVALYYRGKPFCGGVVFRDRYILTTAHCLTDGRGHIEKSAKGIEVRYWGSEKPKRDARKVDKFTVHENLLHQERLSYPFARAADFVNFPINHEDIAILELNGTHPAGSIKCFCP